MSRNERVTAVNELIIKGHSTAEIQKHAAEETDWDVAESTIDSYIAEAVKNFHEDGVAPATLDPEGGEPKEPKEGGEPKEKTEEKTEDKNAQKAAEEQKRIQDKLTKDREDAKKAAEKKAKKAEKKAEKEASAREAAKSEGMKNINQGIEELIAVIDEELPAMDRKGNLRRVRFLKAQLVRTQKTVFKAYNVEKD
jgi:outer membrane biosynthesis protein TonB